MQDADGCLHPDAPSGCTRLIDAHSIQKKGPLQHLKTVVTAMGGAVIFAWPKEMRLMATFMETLLTVPRADMPGALLMFMFSYVSNTFFRPEWWQSLRPAARIRLAEAGRTIQQYYTPVNDRIGPIVDWSITRIDRRD